MVDLRRQRQPDLRLAQVRAAQVRTGKIRRLKPDTAHVGPIQVGIAQGRALKLGMFERHPLHERIGEIGVLELRARQIRALQVGEQELGPLRPGTARDIRLLQLRGGEVGPRQPGIFHLTAGEVGFLEVGAPEIDRVHRGISEPRERELRLARTRAIGLLAVVRHDQVTLVTAVELDIRQVGARQARAVEVGPGHVGLMQIGPVETRIAQIAPPERDRRLARRHVPVDHEIDVGDIEVALEQAEQRPIGPAEEERQRIVRDVVAQRTARHQPLGGVDRPPLEILPQRPVQPFAGNCRDHERHEQDRGKRQQRYQGRERVQRDRAPECLKEARLGTNEKDPEQRQDDDVHDEGDAVRPGDRDAVIRQERELDEEQQDHRNDDQRQPRHPVQAKPHDDAATGPRDGLDEEEVVQFEPQRMGPAPCRFELLHGLVELQRLSGKQHQLRDEPEMEENEEDGRELEEMDEWDLDPEDR